MKIARRRTGMYFHSLPNWSSPYVALAAKLIPVVAKKINEGPDPVAVAEAVFRVIENAGSAKQLSVEAFEANVKEIFGL